MSIAYPNWRIRGAAAFHDKPVNSSLVLKLLNDAVWVPKHDSHEPWRFIYAEGEGKARLVKGLMSILEKTRLHDATPEQREKFERHLMHVPAYLHIVMLEDPCPNIWQENLVAISCLVQHLQWLGREEDLSMLWHNGDDMYSKQYGELIGVKPEEKLVGVIQIGYVDQALRARPRMRIEELTTVIDS